MQSFQKDIIVNKLHKYDKNPIKIIFSGILGGIYISFGALLMSVAKAQGCDSIICGFVFSLGLFAIVVTQSELFTGNCMLIGLTIGDKKFSKKEIFYLLTDNFLENCLGVFLVVVLVMLSGININPIIDVVKTKSSLNIVELIFKGFLCNILVCLAVWMANFAKKDASPIDKFVSVAFPVTAFVACGFEHSIADVFFMSVGIVSCNVLIFHVLFQLFCITIGNIIGGVLFGFLMSKSN